MMQLKRTPLWINHRSRHQVCAATFSAAYVAVYVVAALCLATGAFHPEVDVVEHAAPHAHHESAHSHHSHHHHPTNGAEDTAPAAVPDICDFAIQALAAPAYQIEHQSLHVLAQIEIVGMDHDRVIPVRLRLGPCSRAPPIDTPPCA